MNFSRAIRVVILQPVADNVQHELSELGSVSSHNGQGVVGDGGFRILDRGFVGFSQLVFRVFALGEVHNGGQYELAFIGCYRVFFQGTITIRPVCSLRLYRCKAY